MNDVKIEVYFNNFCFLFFYCNQQPICHPKHSEGERVIIYSESKEPLFVSLGSYCAVATSLRDHELRKAAFPFDWIQTNAHKKFNELLQNDFAGFLDPKFLRPSTTRGSRVYVNTYYHIEFPHDRIHDDFDGFEARYVRRLERFKKLNEYRGKVCFIRIPTHRSNVSSYQWPSEEGLFIEDHSALELEQTLRVMFPKLEFLLVTVSGKERDPNNVFRFLTSNLLIVDIPINQQILALNILIPILKDYIHYNQKNENKFNLNVHSSEFEILRNIPS